MYDDNQYEEIQPEVKFEGLRSVKELLLKVGSYHIAIFMSLNFICV